MKIGLIGLGKMGLNLALNMKDHGIKVVATDAMESARENAIKEGIEVKDTLAQVVDALPEKKIIWVMVPSGVITDQVLDSLARQLNSGDILIDGGNSYYKDTMTRYQRLQKQGVSLIDCGTSGGMKGARYGASLMVGGDIEAVKIAEPIFSNVAQRDGYQYLGKSGSGHFAKMVHNGIEYGMMQAIGEGFDLLKASDFDYDYLQVSKAWSNGSIIEGLLLRSIQTAFEKEATLEDITGRIDDSGEGQWTVQEAMEKKVSTPVIAASLFARYKSKDETHFSEKVVAAMRNEFGGHKVYKK